MNETYKKAIARLDRDYPPPRQAVTLDELCDILPIVLKTLQNQLSNGKCGFPVVRHGGRVTVAKETVAKLIANLDPYAEIGEDDIKPVDQNLVAVTPSLNIAPKKLGRPRNSVRNSDGLQRHAAFAILDILEKRAATEWRELSDQTPKTLPDLEKKRLTKTTDESLTGSLPRRL